ncbi:MAG: hypothetical protein RLZZ385_794 [Pseudomonadota bacterium]|jgi:broad specificity phosphatase PhoE
MLIDLLRHGQPLGGDVLRGRIDHPLSEEGFAQMCRSTGLDARADTGSLPWTGIYSSPLLRCRRFAEHLGERYGLPVYIESDWQEIDYGDWDGLPLSEWRQVAASQFRRFRDDMSALAPPNGETFVDFRERVLGAWQRVQQLPDDSHVLIITHGGVMRVILPTVLGIPLNRTGVFDIPFACLSRLSLSMGDRAGQGSLVFHNGRVS